MVEWHLDHFQTGVIMSKAFINISCRSFDGNDVLMEMEMGKYISVRLLVHMVKISLTFNNFPKWLYHFIFTFVTGEISDGVTFSITKYCWLLHGIFYHSNRLFIIYYCIFGFEVESNNQLMFVYLWLLLRHQLKGRSRDTYKTRNQK